MDWAQIIVVLLVICLSLFVIVAVTLIVMVVRLSLQIRSLMRSAHAVADNISHAVNEVGGITKAVALFEALRQKTMKRNKTKKRGDV